MRCSTKTEAVNNENTQKHLIDTSHTNLMNDFKRLMRKNTFDICYNDNTCNGYMMQIRN